VRAQPNSHASAEGCEQPRADGEGSSHACAAA
jgi:hypothetical protein